MASLRLFLSALRVAMGAVRKSGLRSLLTALGILIGVAAVTIVVALGEGATRAVQGTIDSMGENAFVVTPRSVVRSGARGDRLPPLTEGDAAALTEANTVRYAAPLLTSVAQVSFRENNTAAELYGTNLAFFAIRAWKVADGELWSAEVDSIGASVCVIGRTLARELFEGGDPVGQLIRIGRATLRVVGTLEPKGRSPFGQDQDNVIILPLATMRAKLFPTAPGQIHRALLSADPEASPARVTSEITQILRQRHRLPEGVENDFRVRSQEEFRAMQEQVFGVLEVLLFSIAAISLLVGGIGVMNIMLVSVAERTREIGIRMAIGARELDILLQFLLEAVLLCLVGGIAGALFAVLVVTGLGQATGWQMQVSWRALTVALATSSAIGVMFGFLPARRAAALDPIQALGRE